MGFSATPTGLPVVNPPGAAWRTIPSKAGKHLNAIPIDAANHVLGDNATGRIGSRTTRSVKKI